MPTIDLNIQSTELINAPSMWKYIQHVHQTDQQNAAKLLSALTNKTINESQAASILSREIGTDRRIEGEFLILTVPEAWLKPATKPQPAARPTQQRQKKQDKPVQPQVMDYYEVGAILEHSWGWEQTNIDFFVIVKRSGDWLTLQELPKIVEENRASMTAKETPDLNTPATAKPIRRKIKKANDGKELGTGIHQSYGWASLWDGRPSNSSSYA